MTIFVSAPMNSLPQWSMLRPTIALLMACSIPLGAACGDEAVLPNGQRVKGELSSVGQGRLLFQRTGQSVPLRLDQLHHVCFPPQRFPPLRAGAPYRIGMRGDQHLTGALLDLGKEEVELRTAWCGTLAIPRSAITNAGHAPGFVTVFVDDFEKELKPWRIKGAPVLSSAQHVSGRHCLCFPGPGQAEYTLPVPLPSGRAGINFYDRAQALGLAWQIEAEFAGSSGWPVVRVRLDPQAGSYLAEVSGTAAAKGRLPRKDGWQRLDMEFVRDQLVLSIDEDILLYCRQPACGGALRKVRLTCARLASGTERSRDVYFDDFSLAMTVPELTHRRSDPDQDEIWLLSGDQLFGDVIDATDGKIHLQALFGARAIPWSDVRGIYFRLPSPSTRKPDRNKVRVWLWPGTGYEPDILDGVALSLDKHHLVLRHEVLGQLVIDRKRLHRLEGLSK